MLLKRLVDYSQRIEPSPVGYLKMPIKWIIDLDLNGNFLGMVSTSSESGKRRDRGKEYLAPHVGKTSGIKSRLLAENGEYVLGIARDEKNLKKAKKRHQAFIEQIRRCADDTQEPNVIAVLSFLNKLPLAEHEIPEDFDPSDNATFRVEGIFPMHLDLIMKYWTKAAGGEGQEKAGKETKLLPCIVCGRVKPVLKRLPIKIKGIPGKQRSGLAIISANAPAFESYGLKESLIAPTCQDCAERFSKAANALIEGKITHLTMGLLIYIFWTRDETEFSPASILSQPEPDEVKALLRSALDAKKAAVELDPVPFYAAAFSASGGRVVVRDELETTVPNVQQNLARYFMLHQLQRPEGGEWLPLYALAAATVRDPRKDLPPNVPKIILHMALKGGPMPMWMLFQAVKRNRAEQRVTHNRAALIKMVLLSQEKGKEDTMVQIDPENRNPAYLCGRLLGVLEAIQRAAIPGAGSNIIDRFYGTASSAPASVFGILLRGAQAHLHKLRRDRRGACEALQKKLEEIQSGLQTFPKTLSLEHQGLFALGYYHQRAADRAGAAAYLKAQKTEDEPVEPPETE